MTQENNNIHNRFAAAFLSAMHIFHQMASRAIKTGEIPLAQYRLMMLLHARGPMSISELQTVLSIAQSSASELCLRTEKAGYISKEIDKSDRRRVVYKLSPTGRALIKRRQQQMKRIYSTILEGLTPDEQEELVSSFETISKLLDFDKNRDRECDHLHH